MASQLPGRCHRRPSGQHRAGPSRGASLSSSSSSSPTLFLVSRYQISQNARARMTLKQLVPAHLEALVLPSRK